MFRGRSDIIHHLPANNIWPKESLEWANVVDTPRRPEQLPETNPEGNEADRSSAFARLLGKLLFLAIITLPDVLFAANR